MSLDTNTYFYKLYNKSNHYMLQMLAVSAGLEKTVDSDIKNMFHVYNVFNVGYHSYFSCSSVINDYIKNKTANEILKVTNIKSHAFAVIGLCMYLSKK